MIKVTTYNTAEEILASKTTEQLIRAWDESERMINALKFNPTNEDRNSQWDAVIQARQWITRALQAQLPYDEFCKVVDIPND
jgi:hypothetical protein